MVQSPKSGSSFSQWLRRPWGMAVAVMVGFGVVAALPWVRAAVKVAGGAEPMSLAAVKAEQEKEEAKGRKEHMRDKEPGELKAVVALDGGWYVAGKAGLFFRKDDVLQPVPGVTVLDPRGLAVTATGELLVLDKKNLKIRSAQQVWTEGPALEAHTLTSGGDGFVYAPTKKGLQRSRDGLIWEVVISPDTLAQAAGGTALKEEGKASKDH